MLADDQLENFTLLHSASLEEAHDLVTGIFCEHRLLPLGRSTQVDYRHWVAALPSIGLSLMKYGAHVRVEPREFQSFYLIQVPLAGTSAVLCNSTEIMTHPGRASVHSPHGAMAMDWSADCHKAVVRIDRAALERHLGSLLGETVHAPIAFDPDMDIRHGMAATWMRTVLHLIGELQHNAELASSPLVVGHLEQMLMSTLLHAQPNRYRERLLAPPQRLAPRHIRQAEEFMHANPSRPISIDDLTRLTGVSGRTLYGGFQLFCGKTPMQYLRDIRMEQARCDMQTAAPTFTVTDIATKWGFYQLGRFAADYKARFGESPSVTRNALPAR
ncbi:AraC family transcriptional regulator [Actimicrobium antarcticum]|uniref:AraC family transcriptional regulator n=1 Tax=Actimicrobium antarcticum TaxID=1051899 RepID=A0ABP7SXP0_9BURK